MLINVAKSVPMLFQGMAGNRKSLRSLFQLIAGHYGWRLYPEKSLWMKDKEFFNVPSWVGCSEKHYNLWKIAKSIITSDSITCELGCFRGSSSFHILRCQPKKHYIFDSFEGLSKSSKYDTGELEQGRYSCSLEQVKKYMEDNRVKRNPNDIWALNRPLFKNETIEYMEGWIPERFHEVENVEFDLVHIDLNLYHPVKHSIEYFWPRIKPGGILIHDDQGSKLCKGAIKAFNDYFGNKVIEISSRQGLVFKS